MRESQGGISSAPLEPGPGDIGMRATILKHAGLVAVQDSALRRIDVRNRRSGPWQKMQGETVKEKKAKAPSEATQADAAESLHEIEIYTDGGCINNPGPGGYGVILIHKDHRKELSGGFRRTTNNRMEILAAIRGLEALRSRCRVTIHSDSQYLVNAIEQGWARRWQANGWRRNQKERAINPDLWERLLSLLDKHQVRFKWVRGHAGHTENERADELARSASLGKNLAIDEIYERSPADPAELPWE